MGVCSISLLYAFVICLGSMINGDVGVYTSPTGKKIREIHHLSDTDFKWSFYGSIAFLAAAVGPFATKFLLHIFKGKRRNTMFVITVFALCSWLLNCVTKINIYGGWVARALLGVSIGMYSSICAMYLVELSPDGYSGFYGSLNQIAIFFAQAFFSFLGPFIDYMGFNYFSACVCLVLAVAIWFIPESPVASKSSNSEEKPKISIFQKKYIKSIIIGICFMFLQQFSGINGIVANLADIFRNAGLDLDPNYQSGISILSLFIASFVGSALVDKLGRRFVWVLSSSLSFVGCFIMALNEKFGWSTILPLICIFVYNFGFGLGLGPIPWFVVLELFDPDVREVGNTICVVFNWIFAFVIVMSFPEMKDSMTMFGVMLFFSAVCILAIFFGLFLIKEPGNATLDENEDEHNDDDSILY